MKKQMVKGLALASMKMGTATSISRILGLLRELAFAATFGASGATDAFTVAYRIPNMLRDLFAEGALSSSFIPVFVKERLRDEESAKKLLSSLFLLLFLLTGLLSIIIILSAKPIVLLFTGAEFANDRDKLDLTITLTKIMAPFLCLISLAALMMGVLNSLKFFFVPALCPALFNVAMILSIVFLTKIFSEKGIPPIYALGWGVLIGGGLQFFFQLPFILAKGYGPFKWVNPLSVSKSSMKFIKNFGFGTIGVAAMQLNVLVTTILATSSQVGTISWLMYSFRLFQLPIGVLSVSIAGSNLVYFSNMWKAKKIDEAKTVLQSSYLFSWAILLPATIFLYTMANPIVKIVLERGSFGPHDTMKTGELLRAYALGLPFYGLYKVFSPTFFSIDAAKIPVFISIFCIFCNILFCLQLTPIYGYTILAYGTGLTMLLNTLFQMFFLKKILSLNFSFFFNKKILVIFCLGILCYIISRYLINRVVDLHASSLLLLAQVVFVVFVGKVFYFGSLLFLKKRIY